MEDGQQANGAELIQRAHDPAEAVGEPGYTDPVSGYFVFTRASHLERGVCCGSGCRHCPF